MQSLNLNTNHLNFFNNLYYILVFNMQMSILHLVLIYLLLSLHFLDKSHVIIALLSHKESQQQNSSQCSAEKLHAQLVDSFINDSVVPKLN